MSSIDVKEIEATTIQITQESEYSTIIVKKSKCNVHNAEEQTYNENMHVIENIMISIAHL